MIMISVREVATKKDLKQFIRLPWKIYHGDAYWVPPLIMEEKELYDSKRHPFFLHGDVKFFLAERDGEVVGRIAGIVNHRHNEFHQDKVGFFGFFESIDDLEVTKALFDNAAGFLRSKGMDTM